MKLRIGHLMIVYATVLLFLVSALAPMVSASGKNSTDNILGSGTSTVTSNDNTSAGKVQVNESGESASTSSCSGVSSHNAFGASVVRSSVASTTSVSSGMTTLTSDVLPSIVDIADNLSASSDVVPSVVVKSLSCAGVQSQAAPGAVASYKPDLYWSNIEVYCVEPYNPSNELCQGMLFEVDCTLKNAALFAATDPFISTLFIDDVPRANITLSLGGDGTALWRVGPLELDVGGYHHIYAVADLFNVIDETDETNNYISTSPFFDSCDLIVTAVWLTDSVGNMNPTILAGEGYHVHWQVLNHAQYSTGFASTGPKVNDSVTVDGSVIGTVMSANTRMEEGSSWQAETANYVFFSSPGTHQVTVTTDYDNKNQEANPQGTGESNNALTMEVKAEAPTGWSLQSVWISDAEGNKNPSTITSGQVFNVDYIIDDANNAPITWPLSIEMVLADGKVFATGTDSTGTIHSVPTFVSAVGQHNIEVQFAFWLHANTQTFSINVMKAVWTLLCYSDGDNSLDSYVSDDVNSMPNAGSTQLVSIADQHDSHSGCSRFFVEHGNLFEIQAMGATNMGDPNALTDFVTWGMDRFLADHYLVDLADHGASWVGCCWDDSFNDHLNLSELGHSFSAIASHLGRHVDVVWFDDCLMDSMEIAYQLHDYVDYISGSETNSFTSNFDYGDVLSKITQYAPTATPLLLATKITNLCHMEDDKYTRSQCISTLDLSKISQLAKDVDKLSQWMIDNYPNYGTLMHTARAQTDWYEGPYAQMTEGLIDLVQFCQKLNSTIQNQDVRLLTGTVINDTCSRNGCVVIEEMNTTSANFCHGLGIYFPEIAYINNKLVSYGNHYVFGNDFTSATSWAEFLQIFLEVNNIVLPSGLTVTLLSPSAGDYWSGSRQIQWNGSESGSGSATYDLSLSMDGGATWQALTSVKYIEGSTLTTHSYTLDTSSYADSATCLVKIDFSDDHGGKGSIISGQFTIDNTPPTMKFYHEAGSSKIFLNATDETSGIASISLKLDNGRYRDFPRTRARYITLSDPGLWSYNIWAYAVDRAGNKGDPVLLEVCYLRVSSAYGTPSGSGWYDRGSNARFGISDLTVPDGQGVQHVFVRWISDEEGGYRGSEAGHQLVMREPINETAVWKTQYYLTVLSDHGVTTGEGWFNANSVQSLGVVDSTVSDGSSTRYVLQGWSSGDNGGYTGEGDSCSVTMSGPVTETAIWGTQYLLTVVSDHSSTIGEGWYDEGSTPSIGIVDSIVSDGLGAQYAFQGWSSSDSGGYTGTDPSHTVNMVGPITETASWAHQYQLTMSTNFGSTTPATGNWYTDGTVVGISSLVISREIGSRYTFNGWIGTGTGSYTGTDNSASVTMDSPITETASWTHECQLTMATNFGSTTPTSGNWYTAGTVVSISSAARNMVGSHYIFNGWTGTGSGSYTGTDNAATVTMDDHITETASWTHQFYLTVSSAYGTVGGSGWYDANSNAQATLDSGTVPGTAGTQYVFTGWSGDASGTGLASNDILMDGPKTATALWTTQFQVSFAQSGLDSDASGTVLTVGSTNYAYTDLPVNGIWVDSGTAFSWTSTISGGTGKQFVETGDSGIVSPITASCTSTASYTTQYLLTMATNSGTSNPSLGTSWYNVGSVVPITAYAPSTVTGEQYAWQGWTGSGIGSYMGMDNPATVMMNAPITETASWAHQYQLIVVTNFGSTTPATGNWYTAGTVVGISSVAPSVRSGERYVFNGWSGTGIGSYTGTSSSASVTMNAPISETASWAHQYQLSMAANFGTTTPTLGASWYNAGSVVPISAIAPSTVAGERYVWNGWIGIGNGAYMGTTNLASITVKGPMMEYALWTHQYQLKVTSAHDSPNPASGTWFNSGSRVTERVNSPADQSGGTRYRCTGWSSGTGSIPTTGSSNSVTFTITAPSSLTWNWIAQYKVTFTQSGVRYDLSGAVLRIDGTSYTSANLPVSLWWDRGSQHTFQYLSPLTGSTYKYTLSSTSGTSSIGMTTTQNGVTTVTVTGSGTITGNYAKVKK